MKNQLLSENQVKEMLDITDFRHINKEKVREFASLIPQMSQETAIRCIEQFPNFKDYATTILNKFYSIAEDTIKEDGKNSIAAYNVVLDALKNELNKSPLSKEDRDEIILQMVNIANLIAQQEDKSRSFKERILSYTGKATVAALAIAAGLLGLKITDGLPLGKD